MVLCATRREDSRAIRKAVGAEVAATRTVATVKREVASGKRTDSGTYISGVDDGDWMEGVVLVSKYGVA